jgi:hypothetical protein
MEELGPVIAGVMLAILLTFIERAGLRALALALVAIAFGWGWSQWVGEFDRHWAFALVDAAQVVVAYAATRWLGARHGWTALHRGKPPPP